MAAILSTGPTGLLLPGQTRPTRPKQFAVPNGLAGYWGFDADCLDFAHSLAFDLSGNGNTGTFFNLSATSFAQGQVGGALTFNASSVTFGANPPLASATSYSFFAWVNSSSSAGGVYHTVYANNSLGFWLLGGKINWFAGIDHLGATVMPTGAWFHVGWTSDGSSNLKGYVNGVQDGAFTLSAPFPSGATTGIGAHANNGEPFAGQIDDVRMYNRPLDPWEVIQLYQAGVAGRRDAGRTMPELFDLPVMKPPAVAVTDLHNRYFLADVGSLMSR